MVSTLVRCGCPCRQRQRLDPVDVCPTLPRQLQFRRVPGCRVITKHLTASGKNSQDHGADPLTYTAEGWTPLHCLSLYLDDRGSNNKLAELATEFIARGVPVDARATMLAVSTTGREALRVFNRAVGTWGSCVVEHLQPNNSESPAVIKDRTMLHWAMVHGAVGMASVLVANGADVNAVDEKNPCAG